MDFWIDMGFAVLLRLIRDRRERTKWKAAFRKIYDAIGNAFPEFATGVDQPGLAEPKED